MKILDGRIVRDKIAQRLTSEIAKLKSRPKLVILQVGDLAESNAYIRQKILFGQKIGAIVDHQKLPENISQKNLQTTISKLNTDPSVIGIIVQMPIPASLDKDTIIDSITPQKDVDGLTSVNLKLLWENRSEGHIPATTKGILTLLDYYKIPIAAKKVVVVGRSFLVGKPTALAFLNRNATVTICHKETRNLKLETKNADILVVAITPVPGGIGPMTVASLFENLLEAYKRQT